MASSGGVRIIESDSRFRTELTGAKGTLIIANFKASWCGPCQIIAPKFQELSLKYTSAIFLEVDVDACKETSNQYSVSGTPTFILFRSGVKLDQSQGSDAKALEEKIKKWMGDYEDLGGTVPKGYMDLSSLVNKSQCECLNESDDYTLKNVFQKGSSFYLESDCDEQMLISISFNQPVKLHSLRLYAPDDGTAPKTVKIFCNLTRTLGFDEAEKTNAVQELSLTPEDVAEDVLISLKFVKFQYVQSVTLFVKDNQGNAETTTINSLSFIGATVESTNMNDFKKSELLAIRLSDNHVTWHGSLALINRQPMTLHHLRMKARLPDQKRIYCSAGIESDYNLGLASFSIVLTSAKVAGKEGVALG